MRQQVISDNGTEIITIKWDGERYGLVRKRRDQPHPVVIMMISKELEELLKFYKECKNG